MAVTLESLNNLDKRQLMDQNFFTDLEDFMYGLDADGSPDDAKQAFLSLSSLLAQVDDQSGAIIQKYLPVLCAMRLISLTLVSDEEKAKFVSDNILTLLQQDYADPKYWIRYIFIAYGFAKDLITILQNILSKALAENDSKLGEKNIQITTGTVQPLVKNWIYDYNASISYVKVKRGPAEETAYVNQSANVKTLTTDQRSVLLKLLRLYDWLRYESKFPTLAKGEVEEPETRVAELARSPIPIKPPTNIPSKPQTVFDQKLTQVSAPPPIKPHVASPIAPIKSEVIAPAAKISFDQKLSAVSTAPAHGQDLEALRQRMEQSRVNLTAAPKPAPIQPPPPSASLRMTPQEIQRESTTAELPASIPPRPAPPVPAQIIPPVRQTPPLARIAPIQAPVAQPAVPPVSAAPKPSLDSLNNIRVMEDLKKITIGHLRQGPAAAQIQAMKMKILMLAQVNNLLPYYAVNAFEQSPLFRSYLAVGANLIDDNSVDRAQSFPSAVQKAGIDMSLPEFEAIADLRKEIERL